VRKSREVRIPVVIEKRGRWYVGYAPSIPGINVQERTLKAARESLVSALDELREIDPSALSTALDVEERISEDVLVRLA
jgi:predicted RNase H-like HicB family nuclease